GDRVAVFGRGGVLEQYDEPSRVLSNPASDFVAGFIGADRGYRGLQWRHSTGLPLHDIRTVAEAEIEGLTLGPTDWVLIVKSDGTPFGWINAEGVDVRRKGGSLYDSTYGGGSLFRPDDSLRQALDSALSSPSGLGVAVDGDGRPIGGVLADDVLAALNAQRPEALPKLGSAEDG
ncbi:MAG TPA: ABC transporter ATP-binding protein, partial [Mycobacterium sp.]|nr:ABC transporter ATP-binding protein [Mycobacterium sp.]